LKAAILRGKELSFYIHVLDMENKHKKGQYF